MSILASRVLGVICIAAVTGIAMAATAYADTFNVMDSPRGLFWNMEMGALFGASIGTPLGLAMVTLMFRGSITFRAWVAMLLGAVVGGEIAVLLITALGSSTGLTWACLVGMPLLGASVATFRIRVT